MSEIMKRIQKLRDGRGWYPVYPSLGIGSIAAHHPAIKGRVIFEMRDDLAMDMCCEYCEWRNKKG